MAQPAELYPVLARLIVGSQAHGLASEGSDTDYREIFYIPTRELLTLPRSERPKEAWDAQNKHVDDEAGWELAKWVEMVGRGHPNAVELMFSPDDPEGFSLIDEWEPMRDALRPVLISRAEFVSSTLGYGQNCLTKLLRRDQESRRAKWKSTYLRIMYAGLHFIQTGEYPVNVMDYSWGITVLAAREDRIDRGEVFNIGEALEREFRAVEQDSPLRERPDWDAVNAILIQFRKDHWEE